MRRIGLIVASLWLFVLGTMNAHAYLDPASGSILLQVILGGLAGLAVAGKLFWQRILMFFSSDRKREKQGES